jgi:tetratricopeptide (TPR) repeat protein
MTARRVFVALAVLLVPWTARAASASDAWMVYEQGNAARDSREFGKAMTLYKQAIEMRSTFPEAEMAIGDVYNEEGEADLALLQYEKAYNARKSFTVPDMQYDVLYKSASLLQSLGRYRLMEDKLSAIVGDDVSYRETENSRLRTQVEKNFRDKGLDRVLVLYTFTTTIPAAAHQVLGWYDYRTGRYDVAVSHLLYAVIYRVSQMVRYARDRDVEYQFDTLANLLRLVASDRSLAAYVAETEFYRGLYYLGAAAWANGDAVNARAVWTLLAAQAGARQYQDLSKRQLARPFMEGLLPVEEPVGSGGR